MPSLPRHLAFESRKVGFSPLFADFSKKVINIRGRVSSISLEAVRGYCLPGNLWENAIFMFRRIKLG